MPIETHTHLLLEGKDVWNKERESQNFQPYFSFEDFYEKFREAGKLNRNGRVCLSSYNLADAIFHGTNLSQVDFLHADLRRSQFNGVSLAGTNFRQADLTDARFSVGYLGDADFSSAILKNADLVQVNLSGANLSWSRFWQAKLFPDSEDSTKASSPKVHRVKNVAELIEICFEIEARYDGLGIYFRGERDRGWCLRPSVMRPSELVSEVAPKALTSFVQNDIGCQQRHWQSYIVLLSGIVTPVVAPFCRRQGRGDF